MTYVVVIIAIGLFIMLRAFRISSGAKPPAAPAPPAWYKPDTLTEAAPDRDRDSGYRMAPPLPRAAAQPARRVLSVDLARHSVALDGAELDPANRPSHSSRVRDPGDTTAINRILYGPGLCSPN